MKDVDKLIRSQLTEIESKFNELEQDKQRLTREQNEVLVEQLRLQGEYRKLTQLLEDLKEEVKSGS